MFTEFLKHLISISLLLHVFSCEQEKNSDALENEETYTYQTIVEDLNIPWAFVFLPDNSILITEKSGTLIHFKNGTKTTISGLPEIAQLGQGGLLDIALHPDYQNNGWIYFSFASAQGEGANTAIMRAKLNGNILSDQQVLYKATPNYANGNHFGSRITFDQNNYLYFSIGDRGNRNSNPQDITRDCGKIYRLHDDGRIPDSNPFINTPNAIKAIYSYGHRNPQGLLFNPTTNTLWEHEHGPQGGDEINIISAGKNYGWPVITYGINYDGTPITNLTEKEGMEQPLHYWTPSIAPSGMCFVTSDIYPGWKNQLLVGSLKFQYLNLCYINNQQVTAQEQLFKDIGRVRAIVQGPEGYIYLAVENLGIVKIIPEN